MYGRTYTQEMLDASEPVEVMAEAGYALLTGDPKEVTGGICYSQDVIDALGVEAESIGMDAPKPN